MRAKIDESKCIACGTCVSMCEKCFEIKEGVSHFKEEECADCDLKEVADSCPVGAINVE